MAQQLYEGIDIGGETDGPYHLYAYRLGQSREEALEEIRASIASASVAKTCPRNPQVYKTKSKNAQEAHEAIRPTSVLREPEQPEDSCYKPEQVKLYELIWKRTMACQMDHATLDTVASICMPAKATSFAPPVRPWSSPVSWRSIRKAADDRRTDESEQALPPME